MWTQFLVIFLLTGVNAGTQGKTSERENPFWEICFDQWTQLEKSAEINFNQQIFSNMVEVYRSIQKNRINSRNAKDFSDQQKSKLIAYRIRRKIIAHTGRHLKAKISNNSYSGNKEIRQLADVISKVSEKFFDRIICTAIKGSIFNVPMNKLIDDLSSHNKISQNAAALLCIGSILREHASLSEDSLWELTLKLEENTNSPTEQKFDINLNLFILNGIRRNQLKVTYKISKLTEYQEYYHYSRIQERQIEEFLNNLSESVKSLYFARVVCIRSTTFRDHYITHYGDLETFGLALTLERGKPKPEEREGKWVPHPIGGNYFRFESRALFNLYIFGRHKPPSKLLSDIFSGPPPNYNESTWIAELHDEGVYFVNKNTKTYLCASNETNGYKIHGGTKSSSCLWIVEDCVR